MLMGFDEVKLSDKIIDNYHLDIDKFGFSEVWEKYLFIIKNDPQTFVNRYFPLELIGFMYENGYGVETLYRVCRLLIKLTFKQIYFVIS